MCVHEFMQVVPEVRETQIPTAGIIGICYEPPRMGPGNPKLDHLQDQYVLLPVHPAPAMSVHMQKPNCGLLLPAVEFRMGRKGPPVEKQCASSR